MWQHFDYDLFVLSETKNNENEQQNQHYVPFFLPSMSLSLTNKYLLKCPSDPVLFDCF